MYLIIVYYHAHTSTRSCVFFTLITPFFRLLTVFAYFTRLLQIFVEVVHRLVPTVALLRLTQPPMPVRVDQGQIADWAVLGKFSLQHTTIRVKVFRVTAITPVLNRAFISGSVAERYYDVTVHSQFVILPNAGIRVAFGGCINTEP